MSSLLFTAADTIMKVAGNAPLLTAGGNQTEAGDAGQQALNEVSRIAVWFYNTFYKLILPIILVVLAVLAVVFGILKGVKLAKAESADQQQEAKKNLITFLIGIGVAIALTLVIWILTPTILGWFGVEIVGDQLVPKE